MATKSLQDRRVLIVQRSWIIARALADAFEATGAKVLSMTKLHPDLAVLPDLAVAVLDGTSGDLRKRLSARGIPFVVHTARAQTDEGPIIQKPAAVADVVARVEKLLT
jgi:hypothetical protein